MARFVLCCLVVIVHIAGTDTMQTLQSMPLFCARAANRSKFSLHACLLKPKPTLAIKDKNCLTNMHLENKSAQVVTYLRDAVVQGEDQQHCSCADVHELQFSIAKMQDNNRDLTRRVHRLEFVLAELLDTMQMSDDIAFLEKQTCAGVIYNAELTRPRSLRLLRSGLKDLQKKWAL